MKILVVDDEPDAREIARIVLERGGHDVVVARHPDEALQVLNRTEVDVVLTDLHMPRMDGRQLARMISELHPGTPCIVWSTMSDGDDDEVRPKDVMRLRIDEWVDGSPDGGDIDLSGATEEEPA
jgi:two-component system capsular synthesis sensor histidine kinase RcsC